MKKFMLVPLLALVLLSLVQSPVIAYTPQQIPIEGSSLKMLSAAIAFAFAALAAGWAISKAGSAGLAASAERPELRTTSIIISALGEALAIYGIVVAILILGSS